MPRSLASVGPRMAAALAAAVALGLVSGCSSGSSSGTGVAASSVSDAAASPSAQAASDGAASASQAGPSPLASPPKIADVVGYTYVDVPAGVRSQLEGALAPMASLFSGIEMKTVKKGAVEVGGLVVIGVNDQVAASSDFEARVLPGMISGMAGQGAKVTQQNLSGQAIAVATAPGSAVLAWYHKGRLTMVLSDKSAAALVFAAAYIKRA